MKLTQIAVDNPVFATMMMVALLVMGLFSYRQLGIDQFPNVDFPIVVVTTDYPGASPETVESEISRKIEESVNAIAGLKTLTSRSLEGRSIVIAAPSPGRKRSGSGLPASRNQKLWVVRLSTLTSFTTTPPRHKKSTSASRRPPIP